MAQTHFDERVIENYIPQLQRLPPGDTTRVFTATPTHLAFEQYDLAAQIAVSRHDWLIAYGSSRCPLSLPGRQRRHRVLMPLS